MDEQQVLSGNFLFVSYCHDDNEPIGNDEGFGIIKQDVSVLHQQGARLWYDENLHLMENWRAKVSAILNDPRCVGAIIYNSPRAFVREAMAFERDLIAARAESDDSFNYYCVQPSRSLTSELIRVATELAVQYYDKYVEFFNTYRKKILKMFNDDILMIRETDPDIRTRRIMDEIIKYKGAVDNEANVIGELVQIGAISRNVEAMAFGDYIDKKSEVVVAMPNMPDRILHNGRILIAFEDALYETKRLRWTLLFVRDGDTYFICDEIVAVRDGCTLETFLKNDFLTLAFTDREREVISNIGLLSLEDYNKAMRDNAVFRSMDTYWWINENGVSDGWQMAVRKRILNKRGFVRTLEKGVRPVITIPANKINEIGAKKEKN